MAIGESVLTDKKPPEPKFCPRCGSDSLVSDLVGEHKIYVCAICGDVTDSVSTKDKKPASAASASAYPPPIPNRHQSPPPPPPVPTRPIPPPTLDINTTLTKVKALRIEVPQAVNHWSWPAFFFNWIWAWGIGYYFWVWAFWGTFFLEVVFPPLMLLLLPGHFILCIFLCIRGNYYAYQNGKFRDANHFLMVEQKWMKAIWVWLVLMAALITVLIVLAGISWLLR